MVLTWRDHPAASSDTPKERDRLLEEGAVSKESSTEMQDVLISPSPPPSPLGGRERPSSPETSARWWLGVGCVLGVAVIWTLATVVKQTVFGGMEFNHPFLFNYFCNACYILHLPILYIARTNFNAVPPPDFNWKETARTGAIIAPIWLVAQWGYSWGVSLTTATVSTVLSTTSCVWTYVLAVLFIGEPVLAVKIGSIALVMLGGFLTCLDKEEGSATASYFAPLLDPRGDLFGKSLIIGASMAYAAYTTIMARRMIGMETYWHLATLFGSLGVVTTIVSTPAVLVFQQSLGLNEISWSVFFVLVANGLIENVFCQYLWCLSVLLTSSTVATVGQSLCIPLAMVADVLRAIPVAGATILGSCSVVAGFLMLAKEGEAVERDCSPRRRHLDVGLS